jgi:Mn2+/Fe2+ NRAMP family transporter
VAIVVALIWSSYRAIARLFKWLTLSLAAYILTAFVAHVDWPVALQATLVPRIEWSRGFFAVLVAIFGTTISPYLFFWQAAQEVEEERAKGRGVGRRVLEPNEIRRCNIDVVAGMFASNLVMYFVIVTTAATLHATGRTDIVTAQQAAEALRPLAGAGAFWLFALGLVGTGILAVPVLAGSCAYAISEAAAWRGRSLDRPPRQARKFYIVLIVAMGFGWGLTYTGMDAIRMLFLTAVINGVLAPPLILMILLLVRDRSVMGPRVSSPLLTVLGWATFVLMIGAAIGMLIAA